MIELWWTSLLVLLTVASVCDLYRREIPDSIPALLWLAALGAATFGVAGLQWWMVIAGGVCGLAVGALLFHWAGFGGGDAKLLSGIGAVLGPAGLFVVLFWMALAGGLLALIALARGRREYAYGPAIAAGFVGYLVWPVELFQRMWP